MGRFHLNTGSPIPGLGFWDKHKSENEPSPSAHCSMLPDSGLRVTSWLLLVARTPLVMASRITGSLGATRQNELILS